MWSQSRKIFTWISLLELTVVLGNSGTIVQGVCPGGHRRALCAPVISIWGRRGTGGVCKCSHTSTHTSTHSQLLSHAHTQTTHTVQTLFPPFHAVSLPLPLPLFRSLSKHTHTHMSHKYIHSGINGHCGRTFLLSGCPVFIGQQQSLWVSFNLLLVVV